MRVSVIVPSKDRSWLHRGLLSVFKQQDYPNIELLIADSGQTGPSDVFTRCIESNIHYYWLENDISVGAKRNFLVERAKGEVIVHFDDDDFYSPNYISTVAQLMQQYDFVTLSGWYNRDANTGDFYYWDTTQHSDYQFKPGLSVSVSNPVRNHPLDREKNTWGYGFSYVYKRKLWEQAPFPDVNFAEDFRFFEAIRNKFPIHCFADTSCLVVHSLWEHTLSSCMPQYRLPPFILEQLNQAAAEYYKKFHSSPLSDEFMYFNLKDSDGGDLGHVGRLSMNALLHNCVKLNGIAVNSNGWVKSSIRPQEEWTSLSQCGGGMWIKKSVAEDLGLVTDIVWPAH